MATKPKKKPSKDRERRNAGGSATASGMNFQASVTAIAGSHLLLATRLGWLDGLVEDVPTAIWAETGGPGDDIRIELRNGEILEAQVKRGLSRGDKLWDAMLRLATGLDAGTIQYGALIVSPDTSKIIRSQLSKDCRRLGEGRTDGLSEVGQEWFSRLITAALPVVSVCSRLRVHVVHAEAADQVSVMMARTLLAGLLTSAANVEHVWHRLYQDAHALMERRGRWEQAGLARTLIEMGIETSTAATPASVAARVSSWAFEANRSFSLLGVKSLLSIDEAWLPLKAGVVDPNEREPTDPAEALTRYHAIPSNPRSNRNKQKTLDADWIGRFYTRAVVTGGPGMGKSTLMTRLAYLYARDGFPVLKVRLRDIATRLAGGNGFYESVLQLGLDGSGVPIQQALDSSLADWVLLCDGLDECGMQQELVATRVRQFAAGNPRVRIIVTTRPIGYQTGELSEWRHYELLAPEPERATANLAKLLRAASPKCESGGSDWAVLAKRQLGASAAAGVISRSPQLLGMAASLLVRGGSLGESKTELYQNMFEVIDAEPNSRKEMGNQPDAMILARVFDILGWELIADPLAKISVVLSRSATYLRAELGVPQLKAQSIANTALKYWQQVGLIEEVRHGTGALITFVHKSFAEFAAARLMWTTHDLAERASLLSCCLDDHERWSEVVAFASAKMCEEVLRALLERLTQGDRRALERALSLLAEAPAGVSDETAHHLVRLAFAQADGNNTVLAYRVGLHLVQLVSRFKQVIGALASTRLDSGQPWTQRIAWACAVETVSFDIDVAQAKLREFLANDSRSTSPSLLGGLISNKDPASAFHERIAFALVRGALADQSIERLSTLVEMFAGQAFYTVGFDMKVSNLVHKAGMTLPRVRHQRDDAAITALIPAEYRQADNAALNVLLNTLATLNESFGNGAALDPPLQLSALFDIISLNESPVSDVWWATKTTDREPLREVLRGMIALSVIHPGQLQLEAAAMCARFKGECADPEVWFHPRTVEVDVPELDWSRAGSLGLDRVKLEHAALQGPQWLAVSATNLLESLEPPDPDRVADMLAKAMGIGMLTAGYLARQQGEIGLRLLLSRLDGPITAGFEHLLEILEKTDATWSQMAAGARKAMHAPNVRVAVAAAALALKHVERGAAVTELALEEAYQHWLVNEEPYPKLSGTVPESPRKTLLEAMNHLRPFPDDRLFELLGDTRGDVRDLAMSWLIKRAIQSPKSRSKLVAAMRNKLLHAAAVAKLLDSEIAFDKVEIVHLCDLFSDADPAYRLAALRLIKPHRMPGALLTAKLKALTVDAHAQVGQAARNLWDKLEADGVVN